MRTRTAAVLMFVLAALALAACGGGGSNASKDHEGAAASATAQYFVQEAQGGRLPEGTNVASIGARAIHALSVTSEQKKQSVSLRYCVEYQYRENVTPFKTHARVYIVSLANGQWSIESVKDDGTCEGVA
jgi:outer membrane PBP1 activator LpoA protein